MLCSSVLWKVELPVGKIRYLAERTSEQSVKGAASFLLTADGKIQKERRGLKMELLHAKKPERKDAAHSQAVHIPEMGKCPWKGTLRLWRPAVW